VASPQIDPLHLRIAGAADVEVIRHLINGAFAVEKFFIDGDRIQADGVRNFMAKGKFFVAEDADGAAGCVYMELRGDRAYLGLLAVNPARQRGGVGSMLVTAAENYCRREGCRFMDLRIVNLRKELPEYYRKRGYVPTGTSPFSSDVITKLPCHFVNMSKPLVSE
jgi:GNAT superfamily N-acetyltransferase